MGCNNNYYNKGDYGTSYCPLIQVGDVYQAGFDQEKIDAWIGPKQPPIIFEDLKACPLV